MMTVGNKNMMITGNKSANFIVTGEGNDTIFANAGKDTLNGGDDSDIFIVGRLSGKDIITDYTTGKDKKITVIDGNGTTKKYSDAVKVLSVTDKTKSPVTVGSSIQVIDASARTTKVKITGNTLANIIIGGSKNDTIYGENSKDILSGDIDNDKLFGDEGNDSILSSNGK